jgi:hypothetical protein
MAQAVCRYKDHTLIGNWYEERLDEKRAHPTMVRTSLYNETPVEVQEASDRFISQASRTHSRQAPLPKIPDYSFVNMSTIKHVMNARAPERPIPSHDRTREMREYTTTSHSYHGGRDAADPSRRVIPERKLSNINGYQETSGKGTSYLDKRICSRRMGIATDEHIRVGQSDPKEHTFVQRSWQYNRDVPAALVQPRASGSVTQDTGLSLPVGNEYRQHDAALHKVDIIPGSNSTRSFAKPRATISHISLHDGLGIWADSDL